MKVTPNITADLDDYVELKTLASEAIKRVAELMVVHDIVEIKRIHKTGIFDRPYSKDVVIPLGLPNIPLTISAVRERVGTALLDYLTTIGINRLALEVNKEDIPGMMAIWSPPEKLVPTDKGEAPKGEDLNPTPVNEDQPKESAQTKENETEAQPSAQQEDAPESKDKE